MHVPRHLSSGSGPSCASKPQRARAALIATSVPAQLGMWKWYASTSPAGIFLLPPLPQGEAVQCRCPGDWGTRSESLSMGAGDGTGSSAEEEEEEGGMRAFEAGKPRGAAAPG